VEEPLCGRWNVLGWGGFERARRRCAGECAQQRRGRPHCRFVCSVEQGAGWQDARESRQWTWSVRAQKEAAAKATCSADGRERRHAACCMPAGTDPTALDRRALDIALDHALRCSLAPLPPLRLRCPRLSAVHRPIRVPPHCCSAPAAQHRHASALVRSRPVASPSLSPQVRRMIAGRGRQRIRPPRRVRLSPSPHRVVSAPAQHPLPMALWPLHLRNHC
jgi:hypothetical protein